MALFKFRYGSYTHEPAEVGVTVDEQSRYGPRGFREAVVKRMTLTGRLKGDGTADLKTKAQQLQNAYAQDFKDAALLDGSGNPIASHRLRNRDSLNGVKVVKPPSFPRGSGPEYVTFLHYTIVLEAEFPADPRGALISFEETISTTGTGGPMKILVETLDTEPIEQQVATKTITRMIQAGSAVGRDEYPVVPTPILPSLEIEPQRSISRNRPTHIAGRPTNFRITWQYAFQSARGTAGGPVIPIV